MNELQFDADGHVELQDGRTTKPVAATAYIGTPEAHIAFDYLRLPDGRVALHSYLRTPDKEEDFLYEIHPREEAVGALDSMMADALDFLDEEGWGVDDGRSAEDLLSKLRMEQTVGLH